MAGKVPQPGELRHVITVENYTATGADGHGQPTGSWSTAETTYARIETLSGRLGEYARQLVQTATHRVAMRYTSNLTHRSRINFGGRIFAVGHVENVDERNQWLIATVAEEL